MVEAPQNRRLRWPRIVLGTILILFAVSILMGSASHQNRLKLLHAAPPICLRLDLSTIGAYAGRYTRAYDGVLDDQLRLVIAGSPSTDETRQMLSGLAALMVLRDESGHVISEHAIGADDFHPWNQERGLVITLPLENAKHQAGIYDLSIEVKTPATGMAGHAHCIVAELGFTNVEGLAASFIGFPLGWIALVAGIVVFAKRAKM